jgi:hypothetical protein
MGKLIVINDANWREHIGDGGVIPADHPHSGGEVRICGTIPRRSIYGSLPYAEPMPKTDLIPRTLWPDMIRDGEREQTFLSHLLARNQIPCLDQDGLPYCHAFSPAAALMGLRAFHGLPFVLLSAGSIGGPATGYVARGAAIEDDLEVIVTRGAASVEYVPMMQVSKSGWKPGAEENALLHRVTEWYDLGGTGRMFDEVMTLLLKRIPVCVGLNWWAHAVTYFDPVITPSGRFGVRFRNSWGGDYGDDGYAVLEEGRGTPDDAYAPRTMFLSEN